MAPSTPQTFRNLSPETFERLAQSARSAGIPIDGPRGTASKFGVEVEWDYSPDSRELAVRCLRAPFFLKMHEVDAKIRGLVEASIGS